jgi:two-component system nitrate/nitrite response regulator NarL
VNNVIFVGSLLARAGLKVLLAGSGFSPIGEAATLAEAHRLLGAAHAEDQRAQILLMSSEGRLDGDEEAMLRVIRREQPALRVIILGDAVSLGLLARACPTEIDGYLINDLPAAGLMHALDLIMTGQRILPPCADDPTLRKRPTQKAEFGATATSGLSPRQVQILQLLRVGSSNKAIARDLAISQDTVKIHIQALLRKLNARNRTQAAVWGLGNGIDQVSSLRHEGFTVRACGQPRFPPSRTTALEAQRETAEMRELADAPFDRPRY